MCSRWVYMPGITAIMGLPTWDCRSALQTNLFSVLKFLELLCVLLYITKGARVCHAGCLFLWILDLRWTFVAFLDRAQTILPWEYLKGLHGCVAYHGLCGESAGCCYPLLPCSVAAVSPNPM